MAEITQEQQTAADEAEFARGFGATRGEDADPAPAPPAPEPAPAPVEPAPEPSTPAQAVDPMASLPEEVRNALAAIPALQQGFTELRRVTGHIPQIQSAVDKIAKSIQPPAPPPPQKFEKLDKLRAADGLPEVADAIEEQMEHLRQQFAATAPAPSPEPEPSPAPATKQRTEEAARMDAAVPGWDKIGGSDEFHEWAAKQKDGATILSTTDPLVFANAIGRYQTISASPAAGLNASRQARAAAAVVPTSTARPATPGTETAEDAFAKGFSQGRKRTSV